MPRRATQEPRYIQVSEAAKLKNCNPYTIRRAIARKDLKAVTMPDGRFLLKRSDVESFRMKGPGGRTPGVDLRA